MKKCGHVWGGPYNVRVGARVQPNTFLNAALVMTMDDIQELVSVVMHGYRACHVGRKICRTSDETDNNKARTGLKITPRITPKDCSYIRRTMDLREESRGRNERWRLVVQLFFTLVDALGNSV